MFVFTLPSLFSLRLGWGFVIPFLFFIRGFLSFGLSVVLCFWPLGAEIPNYLFLPYKCAFHIVWVDVGLCSRLTPAPLCIYIILGLCGLLFPGFLMDGLFMYRASLNSYCRHVVLLLRDRCTYLGAAVYACCIG